MLYYIIFIIVFLYMLFHAFIICYFILYDFILYYIIVFYYILCYFMHLLYGFSYHSLLFELNPYTDSLSIYVSLMVVLWFEVCNIASYSKTRTFSVDLNICKMSLPTALVKPFPSLNPALSNWNPNLLAMQSFSCSLVNNMMTWVGSVMIKKYSMCFGCSTVIGE